MKTFEDFVNEQAQAVEGNWVGGDTTPIIHLDSLDPIKFKKQFKVVQESFVVVEGKTLGLFKHKTTNKFRLGYWFDEVLNTKLGKESRLRFQVILYIDLSINKPIQYKLKSAKVYNVDLVFVDVDYRKDKLATLIYNYLISVVGIVILGDKKQYFGARKLWSRLSKQINVIVDIVDIKTGDVLFSDVVLHQGNYDKDFDNRLWTYDGNTHHIRSVLRAIK